MSTLYDILDIACYIINKSTELNGGIGITHLRVQKLCYFVQRYFCRELNRPCFAQELEAWEYGPISVDVYREFNMYSGNCIKYVDSYNKRIGNSLLLTKCVYDEDIIDIKDRKHIEKVIIASMGISDLELAGIALNQDTWYKTYKVGKKNKISICNYY